MWLGAAGALAALGLVACSDSMRIYTDQQTAAASGSGGGGGSATTTTTTGTGGDAATTTTGAGGDECNSNADCPTAAQPIEQSICDTHYHRCVECLVYADCAARPGTVCSDGACVCPTEGESYCAEPARCVDLKTSISDCGDCGHKCYQTCGDSKCTDAWEPTSDVGAPEGRAYHASVWTTTNKLIVWGGLTIHGYTNTGGIYDPAKRVWATLPTDKAPSPRARATAVWTGSKMVVFGGQDSQGALGTAGQYDPATDEWSDIVMEGAPGARFNHTATWTGTDMIVWGGQDAGGTRFADGGIYTPGALTWHSMATVLADTGEPLPARSEHTAVWTGALLHVFGGRDSQGTYLAQPQRYDPGADQWAALGTDLAPSPRAQHTAVWTDTEMIIWGGSNGGPLSDGAYYNSNFWVSMNAAPGYMSSRSQHSAVWMPAIQKMIVWGGLSGGTYLNEGGLYTLSEGTWNVETMPTGPAGRAAHTAVATDQNKMLIWGGMTGGGSFTNSGGLFTP